MARKAVLVRVEGRVQGVGFRAWTLDEAGRLGLDGWVHNELDGSVAARIEGSGEGIEHMLERLRVGPPGAAVTHVSLEESTPEEVSDGFRIVR